MASLGQGARTVPGDTLQGELNPNEIQKMWLNLERTVDKRGGTAKKGYHFADGDDLKRSSVFFQEKIKVTPSVAAPGDTNPCDATANLTEFEANRMLYSGYLPHRIFILLQIR